MSVTQDQNGNTLAYLEPDISIKPDPDLNFPECVKTAIEEQQTRLWQLLGCSRCFEPSIAPSGGQS